MRTYLSFVFVQKTKFLITIAFKMVFCQKIGKIAKLQFNLQIPGHFKF